MTGREGNTVPRQNRVTPFGEIIATPERGTFLGNRGVLHDAAAAQRRRDRPPPARRAGDGRPLEANLHGGPGRVAGRRVRYPGWVGGEGVGSPERRPDGLVVFARLLRQPAPVLH